MREDEEFFLRVLQDLDPRLRSNDPYEVLGISALLRKLLIDGEPLVHKVNRTHRLRLSFHIGLPPNERDLPQFVLWSIQDGFDPETGRPGRPTATVSLEGLLSALVLLSHGIPYTVRDFVAFEANVKGGVHFGKPVDQHQRQLEAMSQFMQFDGGRPSLRQLKAIGRVVRKGLEPLREAITRQP